LLDRGELASTLGSVESGGIEGFWVWAIEVELTEMNDKAAKNKENRISRIFSFSYVSYY
jgi:hypothetical protein